MFNYETLDGIIVFIKKAAPRRAPAKRGGKKPTRKVEEALESDPEEPKRAIAPISLSSYIASQGSQ